MNDINTTKQKTLIKKIIYVYTIENVSKKKQKQKQKMFKINENDNKNSKRYT